MKHLLHPIGCEHPVNTTAAVVVFPKCLGGLESLNCSACPVTETGQIPVQPNSVVEECRDAEWQAVSQPENGSSAKPRIIAAADYLLDLMGYLEANDLNSFAIRPNLPIDAAM